MTTPNSSHWTGATAEWSGSAANCTHHTSRSPVVLHMDELDDQTNAGASLTDGQITVVGRKTREFMAQVSA